MTPQITASQIAWYRTTVGLVVAGLLGLCTWMAFIQGGVASVRDDAQGGVDSVRQEVHAIEVGYAASESRITTLLEVIQADIKEIKDGLK